MLHFILFVFSFIVLWKSADYFVDASHTLALHLKLPPILIGATIVAFGTSAPELFVTGFASYFNQPDVVYGNIFGSNIANLLLIFGLSMVLADIQYSKLFKVQFITNVLVLLSFIFIFKFLEPNRIIAFVVFFIFICYQYFQLKKDSASNLDSPSYSLSKALIIFLGSLIFLVFSSRLLVYEVVNLATIFGVSKAFLSLFLVAFGTSLPELVTTIRFINKGHSDIVIGNVFGSNLFNLAFVLPISWMIFPVTFSTFYFFELSVLLFIYFLVFISFILSKKSSKVFGYFFVVLYCFYIGLIYVKL